MPADTLNDMILGYAVILGILLTYVVTLILRTHAAKKRRKNHPNYPPS